MPELGTFGSVGAGGGQPPLGHPAASLERKSGAGRPAYHLVAERVAGGLADQLERARSDAGTEGEPGRG